MRSLNANNFQEVIDWVTIQLANAPDVDVGEWQAIRDDRPQVRTIEVQDLSFSIPLPISDAPKIAWQLMIEPNLPWAESHFLERISGIPWNPPPSHESWPYAQQSNLAHQAKIPPELDERDWAYLAAFIDADGSITMPKAEGKVHPRIRITQIDKPSLQQIADKFGVGTICERSREATFGKADQMIWQIQAIAEVRWVLERIKPYLILKQEKAQIVIDYLQEATFARERELPGSAVKFSHTYPERFWPPRGYGIRGPHGNLGDVVNLLRERPGTRQAYLPVWHPEDTGSISGGRLPCSLGYHFLIRDGRLKIVYYIRSCDFYRHFRDDAYMAGRLGQWVAEQVKVSPGELVMHISSLHIFSVERAKIKEEANRVIEKAMR